MRLVSKSHGRVEKHTPAHMNEERRREIEARLAHYAERIDRIEDRLQELDREWDIERTLTTNASSLILGGLLLSLVDRRFTLLPAAVAGFLLQHSIQGWCPPIRLFRRLGFRTAREIYLERHALKLLRGDYSGVSSLTDEDSRTRARRVLNALE